MKPMMNEQDTNQQDDSASPSPDNQDNQDNQGDTGLNGGIDDLISTVQSYIDDPKLVTPETLNQLKTDLEDLKTYLDGEESGEPPQGGLMDKMNQMRGGGQ